MADTYKVLSQSQSTVINPAGNGFTDVWEIAVMVTGGPSKGTHFTVTVPNDEHDAEHVKAAIVQRITQLDKVASL